MKLCKTPGVLRGKAWRDGEPEPADWMVSWTGFDESLTGYPALLGSSGGPGIEGSSVSFAECRVTRIGPSPTSLVREAVHLAGDDGAPASRHLPAGASRVARPRIRRAGDARRSLWRRLQRDFSDKQSRRQMAWERQDGIWPPDGRSGTAADLAERYAGATRAGLAGEARQLAANVKQTADLDALRSLYYRSREIDERLARWNDAKVQSLRLAVEDLITDLWDAVSAGARVLAASCRKWRRPSPQRAQTPPARSRAMV